MGGYGTVGSGQGEDSQQYDIHRTQDGGQQDGQQQDESQQQDDDE
jgi:hypothetical protein